VGIEDSLTREERRKKLRLKKEKKMLLLGEAVLPNVI
jgi:hypothetical protein